MTRPETTDERTERLLKSVALPPSPPGLRERVLKAARDRAAARAWTTPGLRMVIWACSLIIILFLFGDAMLSRHAAKRVRALIGGTAAEISPPRVRETLRAGDLGDVLPFIPLVPRKAHSSLTDESRVIDQIEKESANGLDPAKSRD